MVCIDRSYCTVPTTPAPYNSILLCVTVDEEEAAVCEVLVEEEDDECDPRESGPV